MKFEYEIDLAIGATENKTFSKNKVKMRLGNLRLISQLKVYVLSQKLK